MRRPYISIVIPAYNEEQRIQQTIHAVKEFLQAQHYTAELIVVDDGSKDCTVMLLDQAQQGFQEFRLIKNEHRGKAVAVQTGVLAARGEYIIFMDADLATPLCELSKLLVYLERGVMVAIGSREGVGALRIGEPWHRHIMGRAFNLLVGLLLQQSYKDTQCGFKGFRYQAAQRLFRQCQLYTQTSPILKHGAVTGFDVELLFLAAQNKYRVQEVPVEWHYCTGSKVNPLRDSLHLLADVLLVRWNALRGRYSVVSETKPLICAESTEDVLHAAP